jgi:hypothetical protein
MREKQIINDDGTIITVRVVDSGEYFLPHNFIARLQIAKKRLELIAPGYEKVEKKDKRMFLRNLGIKICFNCKYPQPLDNTYCCACLENIKT